MTLSFPGKPLDLLGVACFLFEDTIDVRMELEPHLIWLTDECFRVDVSTGCGLLYGCGLSPVMFEFEEGPSRPSPTGKV